MMEKIKWYQEILRLDPDSRVFFLLAQVYRELGQTEEAIAVLRTGLEHVPTYLEARLLLIQILFEASRPDECFPELAHISSLFEKYPAFWEVWAESATASQNKDLALAARLMASTLRHPEYSLARIIESGLALLQDVRNTFAVSPVPCDSTEPKAKPLAENAGLAQQEDSALTPDAASELPFLFADTAEQETTGVPSVAVSDDAETASFLKQPAIRLFEEEAFEEAPCGEAPVGAMESFDVDPFDVGAIVTNAACPEADTPGAPASFDEGLSIAEDIAEPRDTEAVADKTLAVDSLDVQPEPDAEDTSEDLFASEISSLKALSFFRSAALEDGDEDSLEEGEPTLHTRSMADVLAEQGDIVGALEIYQELEAAAPTPEEAKVLHDCVVALAARISAGEGETLPAEGAGALSASSIPQNRLMSLLESLADRLEARAKA